MLGSNHFTASTLRFLGAASLTATLLAGHALASGSSGCCEKSSAAAASCDVKKSECAPGAKSATAVATGRKATGTKRAVTVRKASVVAGAKAAQTARSAKSAKAVVPAAKTSPVSAGMRIAIDPETHLPMKLSAAQRMAPVGGEGAPSTTGTADGVTVTILPDGTRLVHLGESSMEYTVARRDPSGKFQIDCVSGPDEARKLAAKPAKSAKPAANAAVEK